MSPDPQATPNNPEPEPHQKDMAPAATATARAPRIKEDGNARSHSVTIAEGPDTYGVLNQHSPYNTAYQVGLSDDKGARRTMEDAHSFVVDFGGVKGQGFFAIFDGHAGKHAAEWCGEHFHQHLLQEMNKDQKTPIPDILNKTFHVVDHHLSDMAAESDGKMHSGCTAVTAFIRLEDENGEQPWMGVGAEGEGGAAIVTDDAVPSAGVPVHVNVPATSEGGKEREGSESPGGKKRKGSRIVSAITNALRSPSPSLKEKDTATAPPNPNGGGSGTGSTPPPAESPVQMTHKTAITPPPTSASGAPTRRVLYTANVGDARGVLCRGGRAIRLTYDHKGSDRQEAKRITDAGGFVMSGRVNGVLAVTRSLGDASMKEFVVGAPFTTETDIGEEDEFLILACDGLWDVAEDQTAVDIVRNIDDAQEMSRTLIQHALDKYTNDNVTVLVVRFRHTATPSAAPAAAGASASTASAASAS